MNEVSGESQKWLSNRVTNYPLVTMMAALCVYLIAIAGAIMIDSAIGANRPAGMLLRSLIPLVFAVAAYKLIIVRFGACPRDDLPFSGFLGDLAKGLLSGSILFSLIVGFAAIAGVYTIVGPGQAANIWVSVVTTAIAPGFTEEIMFRGILFRWIEQWAGSFAALLATSALFGLAHIMNPGATWFSSFAIAVEAGLLLGGVYMLTRNLWMAVGLHAAWNFAQGPVFGVPVSGGHVSGLLSAKLSGPVLLSGGSFGLEASLIALIVGTVAGIGFVWLAIRRGEWIKPMWANTAPDLPNPDLQLDNQRKL